MEGNEKSTTFALVMMIESPEYQDLRRALEETTGRKMQTPRDFEFLTMRVYDRTHAQLCVSTLKRLWGYVGKLDNSRGELRLSTLNILASYVGYPSWEAFTTREKNDDVDSSAVFYGQRVLQTKEIAVGGLLQLMWRPNRCLTLRYSGGNVFVVTESRNSKLSVGDTFTCPVFVEQQPLVLTNLIHEGGKPCSYVCGKVGGVTFHYPFS